MDDLELIENSEDPEHVVFYSDVDRDRPTITIEISPVVGGRYPILLDEVQIRSAAAWMNEAVRYLDQHKNTPAREDSTENPKIGAIGSISSGEGS